MFHLQSKVGNDWDTAYCPYHARLTPAIYQTESEAQSALDAKKASWEERPGCMRNVEFGTYRIIENPTDGSDERVLKEYALNNAIRNDPFWRAIFDC